MTVHLDEMDMSFTLSNPNDIARTIDLKVRPVDFPLGWTYKLHNPSPNLDPGESISITLSLSPDRTMLEDTTVRLAVEGFINDDYIGGILFTRTMPKLSLDSGFEIYLPVLLKE